MGSAKLVLVAGVCVSVGALAGPTLTTAAIDKAQEVFVKNTAAEPVPVDVKNSPAVNVGNTPTVHVGNTPTVALAGTPVQFSGAMEFMGASFSSSSDYVVPAGKRLRVDHVTFRGDTDSTKVEWLALRTRIAGQTMSHSILIHPHASNLKVASQSIAAYADPETSVDFFLMLDGPLGSPPVNGYYMQVSFIGVLLDA